MTSPTTQLSGDWLDEPSVLQDISDVDGWRHYVEHRHDNRRPDIHSRAQYDSMTAAEQALSNWRRQRDVANMPQIETPMGTAVRNAIARTLIVNTHATQPGVRNGVMLSADAGLGKSTLVREIAADFDVEQRQQAEYFPSMIGNRDRWIPTAWVNVPPNVTIIALCRAILAFYGDVTRRYSTQSDLTQRVVNAIRGCGTRLLVLDDITRLKMHREADQSAADFIRSLMETSATILGIGVDIPNSGLLYEGHASTGGQRHMTQTRRRFTVHKLDPFTNETSSSFQDWTSHLQKVEADLPLLDKTPGMLTAGDTPAYLLRRTGGVIGTVTRLIAEASIGVIGQEPTAAGGGEYLNREAFDGVLLDHAAEENGTFGSATESTRPRSPRQPSRNRSFNGRGALGDVS